ncbi:MAG TPA: M28 family peptidase, partial [Blastocatellia bacterium]|nr:M28 family peptidase [Blastocatellia bacterium]
MRRLTTMLTLLVLLVTPLLAADNPKANGNKDQFRQEDLKDWLGFIASDELEGRATFSEGLGIAAQYIAGHLKAWGIKPGGDNGSYFQRVSVLGVNTTSHASVTVETNGQTRTFNDGAGITFPRNMGGKRTVTSDQIEFVGYGLALPQVKHDDYKGRNVKGKVAVFIGSGPASIQAQAAQPGQQAQQGQPGQQGPNFFRALGGRSRYAIDQQGAIASIGVGGFGRGGRQQAGQDGGQPGQAAQQPGQQRGGEGQQTPPAGDNAGQQRGGQGGFGGPAVPTRSDFTTVQRLDSQIPPSVTAQDEFFEFLFSGQEVKFAELKEKTAKREPLPGFTLKNVKVSFNVDPEYQVVRTQLTRNVVGIVEGSDPKLKDTYVAFGAHYDHVGYAEGEIVKTANGDRRAGAVGRVTAGAMNDRIWNGADDDGSGTVTLLSVAKAFATGAKPKRSLLFVWHAGEERGLWGSRYYADYPSIPIDHIVAQVNMDMVGRNNEDKAEEANTVYLVGSDRISTELHNITIDANDALPKPLTLDFSANDPADLEQIYYRSDHY